MVGFVIKAYGGIAATSVALSDAETVAEKRDVAINPVPNLVDRYQDAQYVVDHRAEIQAALDYANEHRVEPEQLEAGARESTETLGEIFTTYDQASQAWDSIGTWRVWEGVPESLKHVGNALEARPDFASIGRLADMAETVAPFIANVEVLIPAFYGGVITLVDNFASDEIGGTVTVMAAAFAIAYAVGTAIGFWARRGRPSWVSRKLQSLGARRYQDWYVRNLEFALGNPLYTAARQHTHDELLADPQGALDPEAFQQIEEYFERRLTLMRDPDELVGSHRSGQS